MSYFGAHQILIKCCVFKIYAVLSNTSNKCFEMVYGGKTYHKQLINPTSSYLELQVESAPLR